ncbi:Ig-like domain-containing protein [Haloarchaeobius iranensis]|uniref:Uncharacterized protein n=1 Tax=Haloarchaeobius iranensis TaxID=996166 RepID=A0A1G9UA56_9EURY|nr:Ig-like domain-containing protein [Haloarchaeobius iranensis]SDM56768.1 hypothetical protein SAMN05192554_10417 [Haloarchaeobius iranensis]
MTDDPTESTGADEAASPVAFLLGLVGNAWSTLKTVYYADSVSWRVMKSGGLLFLGLFCWAGSNILYSYNPDLWLLRYPMAYGFLLLAYGPIHHLVTLPLAYRLRRASGWLRTLGQRLPNAMLVVFFVAVLVLGTVPVGAMTVDFRSTLESSGADISPDLHCVKSDVDEDVAVHCHLSDSRGVDSVVVRSGGQDIHVDDDPPYEFTIRASEVRSVRGQQQFTVELRDGEGDLIRRYVRRLALVEEG